jgi:hypothetical protein
VLPVCECVHVCTSEYVSRACVNLCVTCAFVCVRVYKHVSGSMCERVCVRVIFSMHDRIMDVCETMVVCT